MSPQTVEVIPSQGTLALALVLDLSHSSSPKVLVDLVRAAHTVLDRLQPDDEVTLVTFGDRISIDVPPTRDHQRIRLALAGVRRHWAARSATRDALLVASAFVTDTDGFPLVMLLGDGGDTASLLTEKRAAEVTRAAGVVTDVMWAEPDGWDMDIAYGRLPREYIAKESGGTTFSATARDLDATIRRRLDELRHHYILSFVPAGVSHDRLASSGDATEKEPWRRPYAIGILRRLGEVRLGRL